MSVWNEKLCLLGGCGEFCPDSSKTDAVKSFPTPETKRDVRLFLGLTGKYIPQYTIPLTDLTRKSAPKKVIWTAKCTETFEWLKNILCSKPLLRSPDFDKQFILQTDASNRGVGAVLSQSDETGQDLPVAYFCCKFLPIERKHSTVEKECLAIKLSVQAFFLVNLF